MLPGLISGDLEIPDPQVLPVIALFPAPSSSLHWLWEWCKLSSRGMSGNIHTLHHDANSISLLRLPQKHTKNWVA